MHSSASHIIDGAYYQHVRFISSRYKLKHQLSYGGWARNLNRVAKISIQCAVLSSRMVFFGLNDAGSFWNILVILISNGRDLPNKGLPIPGILCNTD